MSSMAADVISANLAPAAMAEPAQRLLAAISRRDVNELNAAVQLFETKVLPDPAVAVYGGRWLAGVGKAHVPGLAQVIQIESLLGELRAGGDALSVWVAQCWAESDGHQKLVQLAEAMIAVWRDLQTEQAVRFGCALATSLAVIQTKVASRLMSRIESLVTPPKGAAAVIELAAAWVDVGCVLTQLPPRFSHCWKNGWHVLSAGGSGPARKPALRWRSCARTFWHLPRRPNFSTPSCGRMRGRQGMCRAWMRVCSIRGKAPRQCAHFRWF